MPTDLPDPPYGDAEKWATDTPIKRATNRWLIALLLSGLLVLLVAGLAHSLRAEPEVVVPSPVAAALSPEAQAYCGRLDRAVATNDPDLFAQSVIGLARDLPGEPAGDAAVRMIAAIDTGDEAAGNQATTDLYVACHPA